MGRIWGVTYIFQYMRIGFSLGWLYAIGFFVAFCIIAGLLIMVFPLVGILVLILVLIGVVLGILQSYRDIQEAKHEHERLEDTK